MTDKQVYDLLTSIDNYDIKPGEITEKELASVEKIIWDNIDYLPHCMNLLIGLKDLKLRFTHTDNITYFPNQTLFSILNSSKIDTINISSLAGLPSLQFLELSGSNIKDLSPLSGLTSLQVLDLSNSIITDLGPLSSLASIHTLSLKGAFIKNLSPLSDLKSLNKLDLRGAVATNIPKSFLNMDLDFVTSRSPYGPGIYIDGLHLVEQEVSIFSQPRELIQEYYKSQENDGLVSVNKCKVVFLGDGGAGKSLIIDRLLHDGKKRLSFNGETTPGININSQTFLIGKDSIELSFWDFGGEAIMHSMHRMFLTNRTLYVIVTNARENNANEQAWYWIQNIKSFTQNAPVFLLVNHRDENPFVDINVNGLRTEYPQLKDFRIVSALMDSVNEFNTNIRDQILKIVQTMESVHAPFPISWIFLMNKLNKMESDRITSDAFYAKCRECNIETEQQIQDNIIRWYQDLGICFYSRKHRVSRKYMVLKPKWLLNALYILIFNGRKYAKNGIISEEKVYDLINEDVSTDNIQKIYNDIEYKETDVDYIIQVLINYNLVRRLDNDSIFVPMLCDENEPEDLEKSISGEALHYSFDYYYLPENVLYRLMIHQWHALNLKKVWKSGASFEQKDFGWTALVRTHGNSLDIYTESQKPVEYPAVRYMDILCDAIRRINNDLGLHAEEYIALRERDHEDRFKRSVLEGSKKAGLPWIYSDVFERIQEIDVLLGKTIKSQDSITEKIIAQMLSALSEMSEQTVYMTDKGEVELTADFQRSIESALNVKYGIQITREYTIGRSKKTIGETDLYFFFF